MGVFDKVLGGPEPLSKTEAFAGVVLYAVTADGVITDEEMEGLTTSLARMRIFSERRQIDVGLKKCLKISTTKGSDELLRRAADAVPKDLKATAFAIAADLLFADGEVSESERDSLERIQEALGVPDATAQRIVEVIAIKNKG